jgi:hypothetical protein
VKVVDVARRKRRPVG